MRKPISLEADEFGFTMRYEWICDCKPKRTHGVQSTLNAGLAADPFAAAEYFKQFGNFILEADGKHEDKSNEFKTMTADEFTAINLKFHRQFHEHFANTGRPPTTCYISQATWHAIQAYLLQHEKMFYLIHKPDKLTVWNGLPVVRVMDENYFELR
jgi:hypothetical protein